MPCSQPNPPQVDRLQPRALIVDSISTVFLRGLDSTAGGTTQALTRPTKPKQPSLPPAPSCAGAVAAQPEPGRACGAAPQVRECAVALQSTAKDRGMALFLSAHVTKDAEIAGPKALEHMVDCTLYLAADSRQEIRMLRGLKNRNGATNEARRPRGVFVHSRRRCRFRHRFASLRGVRLQVGMFEMTAKGLTPLIEASDLFQRNRVDSSEAGLHGASAFTVSMVRQPRRCPRQRRTDHGAGSREAPQPAALSRCRTRHKP